MEKSVPLRWTTLRAIKHTIFFWCIKFQFVLRNNVDKKKKVFFLVDDHKNPGSETGGKKIVIIYSRRISV